MSTLDPSPSLHLTHAAPPTRPSAPVKWFVLAAAAGGLGVIALSLGLFGRGSAGLAGVGLGLAVYALGASVAGVALARTYPHAALGLCNMVTLARLVITATLAGALVAASGPSWSVFALAALALLLDGVDGWLARHQNLASTFGARFDMEVDSAFALVLALHAAVSGAAGLFVVLLGLPRYLFVAASFVLPWLGNPLPERFSRKLVCVIQIGALIALQLPLAASGMLTPVIVGVCLALVWSFALDILWLWRTRT